MLPRVRGRAVIFYFDFISPYAYLAWTQIHALAARHGCAVEPVPVLFAGLLAHHGTRGPAEVPAKRRYLVFDTSRKARALGVPFGPPPYHPFNPLLALRVASVPLAAEVQRALIDRIYAAVWSGAAEHVEAPDTVARLVRDVGLDAAVVLAQATSPDGKARLKSQTEDAIAGGVFGVPTITAGGELFWGVDSLPDLDGFLGGAGPTLDAETLDRWARITPSAER
jgi:2-hydroxychromene-2-carboxylate isomerase